MRRALARELKKRNAFRLPFPEFRNLLYQVDLAEKHAPAAISLDSNGIHYRSRILSLSDPFLEILVESGNRKSAGKASYGYYHSFQLPL